MDPVTLCDGDAYDRRCIVDHFQRGNTVSPVTRKELETTETRPNFALQAAVDDYFRLRDVAEREQKQWVEFVSEMQSRMFRKLDRKNQEVKVLKSALLSSRQSQPLPEQLDQVGEEARRNRRGSTSHSDLASTSDHVAQQSDANCNASTSSGGSGSSKKSNHASNSPDGMASPPAEEQSCNEDKSLPQGPAFGAGPAPRSNRERNARVDGQKPVGLLGRLNFGSRRGKDGKVQ